MIVVTGGTGFLGSNLVAGLSEKGQSNIVVCDTLGSDDKWRNISKYELRDIVRPENLMRYLEIHASEIKVIFHLGAISSTTEADADLIVENNFIFSRRLWKWCADHGVRFIYASSAATYGDGKAGFKDDDHPEALAKLRPLNPYGWSKHLFDRRTSRITHDNTRGGEAAPPQWAGLKFFNVYGPNEYHKGEQMSVVCKLFPQVQAGAAARLFKSYDKDYADGGQIRDFVYVKDCVDVMLWLLDNPKISGLYNVGTGKGRSFNDLATAVFNACGKKPKIHYIDMPGELNAKYQYYTQADMTKLRKAGYAKPFTELEDGVKDYAQNYMMKDDRYR
ncbi:MAG TPA: ADP-glyceromanno-heptose 6-epimerase [Patescibacteria group bacterium]|nr:ADP-glyceromanno-heptose 6-epimerase [Patescibacteria group bacterium]